MDSFVDTLKAEFGYNQPILTEDLLALYPSMTRQGVYKKINAAISSGDLERYGRGVYYLPTETPFGRSGLLATQVVRRRWLEHDDEVFGYKSGFTLANEVGVTTQVPATLEITTNKEKTAVRDIGSFGGWKRVILRKPRRPVTRRNVDALRFLDLITDEDVDQFDEFEFDALKKLARKAGKTMIYDCSQSYPARTAKKLAECERYRVFA